MLHTPDQKPEPMFNVPLIVLVTVGAMVLVHGLREAVSDAANIWVMLHFAFIPARYGPLPPELVFLKDTGPMLWSPLTYALLHGDWTHLFFNGIWLIIFGTPVARRFGALRFTVFMVVLAAAGALAHWLVGHHEAVPMIGASAIVSGLTAAALRFIFVLGGPLGAFSARPEAHHTPAMSFITMMQTPQTVGFIVIWFVLNLGAGLFSQVSADMNPIAWQAHVGGFVAGLMFFSLFDRR